VGSNYRGPVEEPNAQHSLRSGAAASRMSPVWPHRLGDDTGVNRAAIFSRRNYKSRSGRNRSSGRAREGLAASAAGMRMA